MRREYQPDVASGLRIMREEAAFKQGQQSCAAGPLKDPKDIKLRIGYYLCFKADRYPDVAYYYGNDILQDLHGGHPKEFWDQIAEINMGEK